MHLSIGLALAALASSLPAAQQPSPQPRPDTVWVDDDFGPGTSGWGRTRFATIAEGVLRVDVGGTVQVAAGNYPEALVLHKRVHLEGASSLDATILAVPGQDMLTLWASGTSVRGLRFQNDGVPRAALLVRGADRCTLAGNVLAGGALDIRVWTYAQELSDCVITDNRGIAVLQVGVAGYTFPVRACRIERNQAGRIRVEVGVDARIVGNDVDTISSGLDWDGIQLLDCTGTEVRGNTVRSGDGGIMVGGTGNLVVANHVTGPFYTGIGLGHAHDSVVRENTLSGEAFGRGIMLSYTDRAQVLGNRVELPSGALGLFLVECESARLEDNTLTGAGIVLHGKLPIEWDSHVMTDNTFEGRPIHYEAGTIGAVAPLDAGQVILAYCSDFTVEGIRFPPGAPGVQLGGCDSGVVRGCTFLESGPSAVYAWGCQGIELSANLMLDAPTALQEGPSTLFMEDCSACRIRDNHLAFSTLVAPAAKGMELLDCAAFEIVGNTITNYGFALLYRYGPGGSVLHDNSFCSYFSVHDDCQNTWDDGLGHGNYWDDYAGVDEDGDGIGDTPHPISYGAADAYPLMAPPGGALLWSDRHQLSAAAGGTTRLVLEAGRARAGQHYLVLGSASGTSPGTRFGGRLLPLNRDAYFLELLAHPSSAGRVAFAGVLDANGRAVAELTLAPGAQPALAGTTLHHAACVIALDPLGRSDGRSIRVEAITNAVPLFVLE